MSFYTGLSIFSTDIITTQKKHSSAEARRILALLNGYQAEETDFFTEIATETSGRPFFLKKEADFSISHCSYNLKSITAVSFAEGGDYRTGCDIERVRPRNGAEEIAHEFYSAYEKEYIYSAEIFDIKKFYEIWTLKECYIKLKGLSVFDMARIPSFISQSIKFEFNGISALPLSFFLYELTDDSNPVCTDEHYIMAAAIEGARNAAARPPEIIWFSQSSLVCKIKSEIHSLSRA